MRLFQKFDTFRILVCGGDGSVGWVLSEIDSLNLHKQVPGRGWGGEQGHGSGGVEGVWVVAAGRRKGRTGPRGISEAHPGGASEEPEV